MQESQLTMNEALKTRIKQHESALLRAKDRIDACLLLAGRAPRQADVLRDVIRYWERVRNYHAQILEESRLLKMEIARTLPQDPAPS